MCRSLVSWRKREVFGSIRWLCFCLVAAVGTGVAAALNATGSETAHSDRAVLTIILGGVLHVGRLTRRIDSVPREVDTILNGDDGYGVALRRRSGTVR